ncbi:hypothetical protein H5410_015432 [Solanum commersonii]|uniref:Uncharacterized protein n=1 Tax=Solanum commersonii TaxID=4109 RepID=A0A9J5ZTU1_SOLCO|nr:hypothetical protein H5410_015432 [Solanum commersonii]
MFLFFETCQRVGFQNLTTKVEIFMNVYSFFETYRRIGLPNLMTRVEVFMNALLRLQEVSEKQED